MILLINPPFYRFLGLQQDYVPLSLLAVGSKMAESEKVFIKNLEVGGDHYAGYSERADHYNIFIEALNNNEHPVWQELRKTIEDLKPDKIGINVLNEIGRASCRERV